MKKIPHILLLAAVLAGCTKEARQQDWVAADFSVTPDRTAVKSVGDASLVDQLEIKAYDRNGNYLDYIHFSCTQLGNGDFTAKGSLLRGETYTLLFFAQTAGTYTVGEDAVLRQASGIPASTPSMDAFYAVQEVTGGADEKIYVTLKRPFALLHFVSDQARTGARSRLNLNHVPTSMNLLSGQVEGSGNVSFTEETCPSETEVAFAFVLAPETLSRIGASIRVSYGEFDAERILNNIPLRRNYETFLRGDYFTTEGPLEVEIDAQP